MKRKKGITDARVAKALGWTLPRQPKIVKAQLWHDPEGALCVLPDYTESLDAIVYEITNLDRDGVRFCWDCVNTLYGPTGHWDAVACCDALLHWLEDK